MTAIKTRLDVRESPRHVKEWLELISEVENRIEKQDRNAWRNPDAKPPKGPFEDSLAKDRLVSHIFGRPITWFDWAEIRTFLTDYDLSANNIPLDRSLRFLRSAWPYRDKKQAPHICFRMTPQIRLDYWCYNLLLHFWLLLMLFGNLLICIGFIASCLMSLKIPHLPDWLKWFEVSNSSQALKLGYTITPLAVLGFLIILFISYPVYAAREIAKRTNPSPSANFLIGRKCSAVRAG